MDEEQREVVESTGQNDEGRASSGDEGCMTDSYLLTLWLGVTLTVGMVLDRVPVGPTSGHTVFLCVTALLLLVRLAYRGAVPTLKCLGSRVFLWVVAFAGGYSTAFFLAEHATVVAFAADVAADTRAVPIRMALLIGACAVMVVFLRQIRDWRIVTRVAAVVSIVVVVSLVTDALGLTRIGYALTGARYLLLSPGLLREANFGAQLLSVILALNTYGALIDRTRYRRLHVIAMTCTIMGIVLTGSRMGWIMLVVQLVATGMVVPSGRRLVVRSLFVAVLGAALLGSVFIALKPQAAHDYLGRALGVADSLSGKGTMDASLAKRLELLTVGVAGWLGSPVAGIGPQSTQAFFRSHPGVTNAYAHNSFLEVALGAGLLGLIPYLGLTLTVGVMLWPRRYRSMSHEQFLLASVMFVGYVGLVVTLFFLSDVANKLLWTFYAPLAVVFSTEGNGRRGRQRDGL
jgi:hypothetical protein